MTDVVTDTHALIWYLEDSPRLSASASQVFDRCDRGELVIYIPTICLVEIVYLQEKRRISANLKAQLDEALSTGNSGLVLFDLTIGIVEALAKIPREAVPDLPDHVIAATALHLGLPLISCDRRMPLAGIPLIWD
ncbi:MAG: type II toxin-antitoxin system VapC family toxin [Pseudanabaena sp.]|jgi:PIN domain nuclease of toxin-antitoxin system